MIFARRIVNGSWDMRAEIKHLIGKHIIQIHNPKPAKEIDYEAKARIYAGLPKKEKK
jgi:hypothetical protein